MKNKAKWIKRQQEIVDAARADGRGLTAEEQAEFDELQRKIEAEPDDNGGGGEPAGGRRSVGGQDPVNTHTPPHAGAPSGPWRRSASGSVTFWPCAARQAWTRRSISATGPPWTPYGPPLWTT